MRAGWQIAQAAGLIDAAALRALIEAQAAAIKRQLAQPALAAPAHQTLSELQREYAQALA